MKLLLIEDEPRLQRSLAKALREEHYAVDLSVSGEEGLFKAECADYDVVILDVMLPVLDGWQVLERLRQHKSTPVLMLTARDASIDRVRGLDLGADDYLVKPFDLPELLARIRALIRRMAGRAAAVIRLGSIVIDTRSRTDTKTEVPVPLTAREFCILEYLAMHRGKAVSRTELHDHLLDENEDTLSNLLDDLSPAPVVNRPERILPVVMNLLLNAISYTRSDDTYATVSVADNGIGIGRADLPHIFDRFYRADKVRSRLGGHAGLGLSICKAIVDTESGTIQVQSEIGKGTVFTVRLPVISFV